MQTIQSILHFLFFGQWAYLAKIGLGILVLIGLNAFLKKVLNEIRKRSLSKFRNWKEKIDHVVHLPCYLACWIIGLSFGFNILKEHFGFSDLPYIQTIRNAILVGCGAWLILRWINVFTQIVIEKSKNTTVSSQTIHILRKICNFTTIVLSVLLILQILGLNIVPLLAFGGIGAAALGIAAKDVIANFFGGMMLYLTRPFMEGDMILVPHHADLMGTVEEIGLYMTKIRDIEKRPVYLPNSQFASHLIINMSRMTHRRIFETIKIRMQDFDKIPAILEMIKTEILNHERIDTHLPVHVVFKEFGASSLDIHIEAYTLATRFEDFLKVKQEILLRIWEILKSHQAEISIPTSNLHIKEGPMQSLQAGISHSHFS